MRKLIFIIASIIFMTFLACVPTFAAEYPGLLRISEVRDSVIVGVDANGNEWLFCDPCEDWQNGDLCAVIFDDKGTPNYIYDDVITEMRYVGYVELYQ